MALRDFAWRVLSSGELDDKLAAPAPIDTLDDVTGATDVTDATAVPRAPRRSAELAFSDDAERLPSLSSLAEPSARASCLSRFAHHELQAVELFAWVLLACPAAPRALRQGFLAALVDEQRHCRLYLERLAAHGVRFGALPLSGYFWRHIDAIADAPDPLLAFLCAQGLTLEQANLDFTLLYRDAFRRAGDEDTARVLQVVHDDEIGHVALAATWAQRLGGGADVDVVDVYRAHTPFPFSLARAKARRFDVAARKRARLSPAMIEAVRAARPYG